MAARGCPSPSLPQLLRDMGLEPSLAVTPGIGAELPSHAYGDKIKLFGNSSAEAAAKPMDQVSLTAARDHPTTRAGVLDDVS